MAVQVIIPPKTPYAVSLMLTYANYIIAPSYVDSAKAIKNEVEIEGFRRAYMRDGVAMVSAALSFVDSSNVSPDKMVCLARGAAPRRKYDYRMGGQRDVDPVQETGGLLYGSCV